MPGGLPEICIAAAFRAEMKANAITAVAAPLINLALAFEPNRVFQISRAEVEGRASAALARFAVAQVHLLGIARGGRPQRSAMAFCYSLHRDVSGHWLLVKCRNADSIYALEPTADLGCLSSGRLASSAWAAAIRSLYPAFQASRSVAGSNRPAFLLSVAARANVKNTSSPHRPIAPSPHAEVHRDAHQPHVYPLYIRRSTISDRCSARRDV